MPKKELKTLHSEESKLGPNAERFTKFLENGLHCFDECLTDFRPTYVQHEKQGIGLLFTQLREDDWGIDNRAQEERRYLEKFKKVFSPEEFIKEYK